MSDSYDVIVIGSGSGGAPVVRRLVDLGARVLLLEAGGMDVNPAIHEPARVFELWNTEEDWALPSVAMASCNDRVLVMPRGKVFGGSSCLNGMIYVRGAHGDFDAWAEAAGDPSWRYEEVLPLFKRSEDFDRGENEFHGAGGPLRVISQYEPHPMIRAAVEATQEIGIPFNDDYNGAEIEGVDYAQLTIKDGIRHNVAEAFLRPVLDAPNLTVRLNATAQRLLFDGTRCTGVEYVAEGSLERAHASHEVVLAGGTFGSPQLLLLSGIGPAEQLQRVGVETLVDLPGVGENLHDHAILPTIYSSKQPIPPALPGLQQLHGQFFWHSREGLDRPDLQPLFFHLPLYVDGMEGPADAFTLAAGVIRPESRGSLRLTGADASAPLEFDVAYLKEQVDIDAMAVAIELCREIAQQSALSEWTEAELYPGPDARTVEDLRRYMCQNVTTYHHQVGTCKMGTDELAVVDGSLRVRGVEGLRIADASVMPEVTSGNTHAATIMIGERCADLVAAGLSTRAAEAATA